MTAMIELTLPIKIISPHRSGHWTKDLALKKKNYRIIGWYWKTMSIKPKLPCKIYLERIYSNKDKGKAMDYDRLVGAFAGIRDIIAALINPDAIVCYRRKGKLIKNPGHADHEKYGLEFFYSQAEGKVSEIKIKFEGEPCLLSNVANAITN